MSTARQAACLVYAFNGRTDAQIQLDVAFAADVCGIGDELDVFAALDDLVGAVETLEIAANG